jgi:hypothetical protein
MTTIVPHEKEINNDKRLSSVYKIMRLLLVHLYVLKHINNNSVDEIHNKLPTWYKLFQISDIIQSSQIIGDTDQLYVFKHISKQFC